VFNLLPEDERDPKLKEQISRAIEITKKAFYTKTDLTIFIPDGN